MAKPSSSLDFRGRLDPLARHLFHFGDHVALARRRVELDESEFVDTGVAITLKIVARNRFGVGGERHIDLGALAPRRLDQLVKALHLRRCLIGREIEAAPSIAVISDALERRAALAAEPNRNLSAN